MNINEFLVKLFGSADSSAEYEQVEQWKDETKANAKSLQDMLQVNTESENLSGYKNFDIEQALNVNLKMIEEDVQGQDTRQKKGTTKTVALLVALLLLLAGGLYTINKLANTEDYQYASTPGKTMLQNGVAVTLNDNSTFAYHHKTNNLMLNGEAHFDVAKQELPFIITTEHGNITVLGTEFNVKATSEDTEVFMYQGIVRFDKEEQSVSLKEGDLLVASRDLHVSHKVPSQVYSYWQNGRLDYKNVPLTNVLDDINRLYGKSLSAASVNSDEILITSSFEGNTLEEIIMILEKIANVSIK